MTSNALRLGALAIALGLLVFTASRELVYLHAAICILVALALTIAAVVGHRDAEVSGASTGLILGGDAGNMGWIWGFGALAMAAMYGPKILDWKEWWHFVLGFAAAALSSFYFAGRLRGMSENDSGSNLLKITRYLSIAQIVGMVAVIVGLVIDGKMDRLGLTFSGPRHNPPADWAANNVFFFSAMALLVVNWVSLGTKRRIT